MSARPRNVLHLTGNLRQRLKAIRPPRNLTHNLQSTAPATKSAVHPSKVLCPTEFNLATAQSAGPATKLAQNMLKCRATSSSTKASRLYDGANENTTRSILHGTCQAKHLKTTTTKTQIAMSRQGNRATFENTEPAQQNRTSRLKSYDSRTGRAKNSAPQVISSATFSASQSHGEFDTCGRFCKHKQMSNARVLLVNS